MVPNNRASWSIRRHLDGLRSDLTYSWRRIAARRLPTLVVVLTLAVGIGANTGIFSAVRAVLWNPMSVSRVDELVFVHNDFPGLNIHRTQVSAAEARDLLARTDLFTEAVALSSSSVNLTGFGEPQRLLATSTMGDLFSVLAASPYLGRFYRHEDVEAGNTSSIVLSFGLWQRLTGGDPNIIGTTLWLNDEPYEVVAVARPELEYPRQSEIWLPLRVTSAMVAPDSRAALRFTFLARVRPEMGWDRLREQLDIEAARWHEQFGSSAYDPASGHTLVFASFVERIAGPLRPVLLLLAASVALVLLIACANVASMLLVEAIARRGELAVRVALGAPRTRIVQQLLVESLTLALIGGLFGLGVGAALLRAFTRFDAPEVSALRGAELDVQALAFTTLISVLAALVFGLFPAFRAARIKTGDAFNVAVERRSSVGAPELRFLNGIVAFEVALTLLLVLGSGLLLRSLAKVLEVDPGFRPEQVFTMKLSLTGPRYTTEESRLVFQRALLENLSATPGIEASTAAFGLPFTRLGDSSPISIVGRSLAPGPPRPHANVWYVSEEYFRTLSIPLIRGRVFTNEAERIAVVDEAFADQFFPSEDAVGRQIQQGQMVTTVIGVVGTVKDRDLRERAKPTVYYDAMREGGWVTTWTVAVRSSLPTGAVSTMLRAAVRELDPSLPVYEMLPMHARIETTLTAPRLAIWLLATFAVLSMLLAVFGIYGVVSYAVSQRRKEIGIRIAIGASPNSISRMVILRGLGSAAAGLLLGTGAFLAMSRLLGTLIYGVSTWDPITLGGGLAVVTASALLATCLPARKAARIDPAKTIRSD